VIEEVAGAVKDLIKAGRVRHFGMSEAAAGPFGFSALQHAHERVGDHWQPKERRGPSDQQADGDVDTAAPNAGSSTGISGRVRLARSGADRVFGTGAGCRDGSDSVRCVLLVVR
jgi:hypothetical protein